MDVIGNLERVLKLILKGDRIDRDENTKITELMTKQGEISGNIGKASWNDHTYDTHRLENVLTSTELLLKVLSKNYEKGFQVIIEYIFCQTKNILYSAMYNERLLKFTHHLFNIIELFLEVTITHPSDSNIKTLKNFYTCNINEINLMEKRELEVDGGEDNEKTFSMVQELNMRLKILSIVYERIYLLNKKNKKVNDNYYFQQLFNNIICENEESKVFMKLVCTRTDSLMIQTLIDIIPIYLKITENYELLLLVWEKLHSFYKTDNVGISRIFIIFCYLSDFYFLKVNRKMMTNIFSDNSYWILLQYGLTNQDSTIRKEALFLMKKSLSFIVDNNIEFYCYKNERKDSKEKERIDKELLLIYWDTSVNFNDFNDLCTIIEYLEEKQVHIVKPIFSTVEKLLNNMAEHNIDITWTLVIIERMLSHDNIKIIRQGLSNLLKISTICFYENDLMEKSIKLLLTSLNCTQIYMGNLSQLLEELNLYFEKCSVQKNGKVFFRILIKEMSSIQWSSEALFAVSYSLKSIKSKQFWEIEDINFIKTLITTGTANHYTYIKSGMHCHLLFAGINLIDTCNVSLEDIDGLLNCFSTKSSLQRKSLLWDYIVKWIRNSYTTDDALNFIISASGKRNIGKMMILLYDTFAYDGVFLKEMKHLLKKICATFINIHLRPYCDKELAETYLATVFDMMEQTSGDFELWDFFDPVISDIVLFIKLQLESAYHMRDFQFTNVLIEYLNIILNNFRQHSVLLDVMGKWFEETVIYLSEDHSNRKLPLQEFIRIRLLNLMTDFTSRDICTIELYLRKELNSSLMRSAEDSTLTKDLLVLWGRMNSEYLHEKWKLLSRMKAACTNILKVSNSEFILRCFEALDLGGTAVLFPLLCVLRKQLPSLLDESRLEELIRNIWRTLMEKKKNDECQNLIKRFIEVLYQEEVIQCGNDQIRRMLLDYSQWMISENMTTAAITLLKQVQKIGFLKEGIVFFEDFLPRALLYGQTLRKDERLIRDICSIIENSGLSPLANDFASSSDVRARSLQIVLTLSPTNEADCRFAENLMNTLRLSEEEISRNKTRYFSDSYIHRVKQRFLQTLLVLESYLTKEGIDTLWNWLAQKILVENNQPSVRYLQEWLMVRIIYRDHRFINVLWTYFDESLEKRTGSLCSLISIIYHTLKCIPNDEIASFIDKTVPVFLPYCMAQHFSVRLYAQVALEKLLHTAETLGLKTVIEKYSLIKKSLKESIERGKAVKNSTKMQEDFYFSVFDPVKHYSLQTIFYELPRLTNVNKDELIPVYTFEKCGLVSNEFVIPLSNKEDSLLKFTCGKWIFDASKQECFMEESNGLNFQKKMIPVKCLMPEREELFQTVSFSAEKMEKDGLIVVASLIDRIPNLGGLSRTCEVFGVTELVLGSLMYTQDKQFQSLSVTAEKWITITEMKPFHLSDYLIGMKREGYTILGAEQTANSQPLQSVKFPKKSLLLLGNEKEGIPPTLLPLMDICIEIPQIGVIRSLNVHVTGALFLWEYAKQHNFSSSL